MVSSATTTSGQSLAVILAGADLYLADLSDTAEMSYVYLYSYDLPEGQGGHESGSFFHGGTTGFFQTSEVEMFQIA